MLLHPLKDPVPPPLAARTRAVLSILAEVSHAEALDPAYHTLTGVLHAAWYKPHSSQGGSHGDPEAMGIYLPNSTPERASQAQEREDEAMSDAHAGSPPRVGVFLSPRGRERISAITRARSHPHSPREGALDPNVNAMGLTPTSVTLYQEKK